MLEILKNCGVEDEKASEIYQKRAEQLTQTGEDIEGKKVMRELLAYIDEIADFVEEYEDTPNLGRCAVQNRVF